jgi:hypothetical protein
MFVETVMAMGPSGNETGLFTSRMEFGDFVLMAISLIVLFAWVFSILYILWWGVLLILSGWKDEKIKPAINSIRYALIGLWVIVLSIFVFPKLAWLLWLDVSKYSSPDKIFMEIKNIWDKIFGNTTWSDVYLEWDIKSVETLPTDFSDL